MSPRQLLWVALAAGLTGLGVSAYLTFVHFSAAPLVCATGGVVNCELVLTSPYGTILGTAVPTSAAGLLWFAVSSSLAALRLRGAAPELLPRLHLAWAAVALLTVLYLVFLEVDRLGAICAWCTAAHILVLVTFLSVLALSFGAGVPEPARR